jgi:CheY-like chemotaxis protein
VSAPRRRALVIDDDPGVCRLLGECLGMQGYDVDCVSNGNAGLALFEVGKYVLVVTDLVMPGMWGWELAERVRQQDAGTGIVLATGSARDLDATRREDLRVVVLSKPFSLHELLAAADQALTLVGMSAKGQGEAPREGEQGTAGPREVGSRSADWLDLLRTAKATAQTLGDHLAGLVEYTERIVREQANLAERHRATVAALTRLQGEYDATVRALQDSRAQGQALAELRRQTVRDLESIIRRLRPAS